MNYAIVVGEDHEGFPTKRKVHLLEDWGDGFYFIKWSGEKAYMSIIQSDGFMHHKEGMCFIYKPNLVFTGVVDKMI